MSVAIVSTPSVPTLAPATDTAGGDASAGEGFADLLLGQLALGTGPLPTATEVASVLPVKGEDPDLGEETDTAIGSDTNSLLATLALVTPQVTAQPSAPATASTESEATGAATLTAQASPSFEKDAKAPGSSAPVSTTAFSAEGSDADAAAKIAVAPAPIEGNSLDKIAIAPAPLENNSQGKTAVAPVPTNGNSFDTIAVAPVPLENEPGLETVAADTQTTTLLPTTHTPHVSADKGGPRNDTQLSVATPVRNQEWASEFSQKVVWLASADKQSAQLTLNPAELGPIEISLSMDKGNATVSFASANAEVRDSIETAMPRLREMFASAGIELGQTNVGAESFRQQSGNGEGNQSASRSMTDNAILAGDTALPLQSRGFSSQQGSGLVNLFA